MVAEKSSNHIDAQSLIEVLQMQRNDAMDRLAKTAAYAKQLEDRVSALESLAKTWREKPKGEGGADAAKQ